MNKVYIQPSTGVVCVCMESAILAGSVDVGGEDTVEIERQDGFDEGEITFDDWD